MEVEEEGEEEEVEGGEGGRSGLLEWTRLEEGVEVSVWLFDSLVSASPL